MRQEMKGTFVGTLNVRALLEDVYRRWGKQEGVTVELLSIEKKPDTPPKKGELPRKCDP